MKIKTSELEGVALDWAVGLCMGWQYRECRDLTVMGWYDGKRENFQCSSWKPSSSWSQGGPILAQMVESGEWGCEPDRNGAVEVSNQDSESIPYDHDWDKPYAYGSGSTVLIAVCRAKVAYALGDTVDVPDELA